MPAVGPVLTAGPAADAVVAAIRELNAGVRVLDRGAYHRVEAPRSCVVTRAAIERHLGARFELPGDLEAILASFAGRFTVTTERAEWTDAGTDAPGRGGAR